MPLAPQGRIGGAGRPVAPEKQLDPELPNEFCYPASPCSIRGGCDRRGNSECNRPGVASEAARS